MTDGRLVFRCGGCGGINRVDPTRVQDGPRCGRCQSALPLDGHPIEVSDEVLVRLVQSAPVPVLVDFFATWCGPCRMVAPLVDELARERAGRLIVVKVDTDRSPEVFQQLGARGVPTFALFRDGAPARVQSGALPLPALRQFVDAP